jgi:trichothecene 3-O-acetyltransferase
MALEPIHTPLNALDSLPRTNYSNIILHMPLKSNVSHEEAFNVLQEGLHRTFVQLP